MNPSFSTLLPKCQMFQHTHTHTIFLKPGASRLRSQEEQLAGRGLRPPGDCTVSHTSCRLYRPYTEWNEWGLQGGHFFCIFFPRGNGHLFNCLSFTVPVAHYTRAPNKHCGPHTHTHACWHERVHADLCHASYSTPRCSWAKTATLK